MNQNINSLIMPANYKNNNNLNIDDNVDDNIEHFYRQSSNNSKNQNISSRNIKSNYNSSIGNRYNHIINSKTAISPNLKSSLQINQKSLSPRLDDLLSSKNSLTNTSVYNKFKQNDLILPKKNNYNLSKNNKITNFSNSKIVQNQITPSITNKKYIDALTNNLNTKNQIKKNSNYVIDNKEQNLYLDYPKKYYNWKNKYYYNKNWRYNPGYYDSNNWINGYWYWYPIPYLYNNNDNNNDNNDDNKINEEEQITQNNSEEFNKFLLDEIMNLKYKLTELEKSKKKLNSEELDEISEEKKNMIKFLNNKIEDNDLISDNQQSINKSQPDLLESYSSDTFIYHIIILILILDLIYIIYNNL